MGPTSLDDLLKEDGVTLIHDGMDVIIHSSWIIQGEDRLSYSTLIRLVECCREHHWNKDILPNAEGVFVDSIVRAVNGEFFHPISLGSKISIVYRVSSVHEKSYSLEFTVYDNSRKHLYAKFDLVSVFYDPISQRSVVPGKSLLSYLTENI